MKTLSLITAFLLLFSLSAGAQQERSAKNTTTPPAQGEVMYQPVETSVPVKSAILGGGALGDCFYYGDPCGMYLDKNWTGGEAKLLEHEGEVAAFIRSEHLNTKKHDDLVKVFSYYNQLD